MKKLLSIAIVLLACTKSEPAPPPVSEPAPNVAEKPADKPAPSDDEATPPLTVQVDGPQSPTANSDLDLVVKIVRSRASDVPVTLSIALPAGATLVAGKSAETIVDNATPTIERRLKIHIGAVPADDLVVAADSKTAASGAHAEKAYRFGRAEPKLPQPTPTGPSLKVKGKGMGGAPIKAD
ncbi:MAG: hypothetical protein ACXWUG_02995 [Polyangiales bacterium]